MEGSWSCERDCAAFAIVSPLWRQVADVRIFMSSRDESGAMVRVRSYGV